MKKLVVFTGAGISAESGLQTFRDSDGLWEGHRIEDVATPRAWLKDKSQVLRFYNLRRKNILNALPNSAHKALHALEKNFDVYIITQNIDDLHERAGSSKVLHLHGEIFKMRSEQNEALIYPISGDIQVGDMADDGSQLRPHIVWFEEAVPNMDKAIKLTLEADIFVVVGTSLVVYPAASLVHYIPAHIPIVLLDKKIPTVRHNKLYTIEKVATEGIDDLADLLYQFI